MILKLQGISEDCIIIQMKDVLGMSLISNAKWNMTSQLFKVAAQAINIVYLATIIPPAEYGLMAMALVVFNFGILLRDLGTSAAIIQRKELTNNLINTVFWLNTFMGVGLAIVIALSSPFFSYLYHQPKLIPILLLLSITFPLSSSAAAHLALLERDSKFRQISLIEISSSLVSVLVAIILANLGFGVYSLVVQAIVLNLISCIQFWFVSPWRPLFTRFVDKKEFKIIFGFSVNLSLFNFINYFSRNADSFIIGRFMSATVLGSYNLAYRIMLFPLQSLTFVTSRSLYPILSKSQDDNKEIYSTYSNCVFVIVLITAPLMSGLAFYSEPFIRLVFGPQWHITSDVLKWLAPTAIIQAILSTSGSVFMAKGRTDILMRLGIIGAVLQVSAFVIGVNYTITTFAMCYLIANVLNFFPVMISLFRVINGSFRIFVMQFVPIIISTLIMLLVLSILNIYYHQEEINGLLTLFLFSVLGAVIYFIFIIILAKKIRLFLFKKY